MKFATDKLTLDNNNGVRGVFIETPLNLLDKLKALIDKEGLKSIEIKKKSKARSISANAYHWILISNLAKMLTIPKGDLYVKMIKRYGQHTSIIIKAEAVEQFIRIWDLTNTEVEHVESLCEVTRGFTNNRVKWVEVNCHFGSSSYDAEKFHYLLEGIISECKIMDIETLPPNEIKTMMEGYEV